jgi:glycosyltransferase involved in cell wall biosynthesis
MIDMTDKKLIIAFDAKRLFNNNTGLGNYSRTLVKNLQVYYPQHEYHLFTTKSPKNIETEYFFDPEKFTIHKPSFNTPLWRILGMSGPINALKPDIFHGLSHEIPFGLDASIYTFVSFHDLIYERFPHQFGWLNSRLYRWKYKSSVKRADSVVAISESTKNDLVELYKTESSKIVVIYQSCHEIYQQEKLTSEQDSDFPFSNYYLYVGSIIERKGLLQTIIAYGNLPVLYRRPFVIVGKGNASYISKVKDMISYYGIADSIHFITTVSKVQLCRLYDQSFAFLYPSIYEGFGIPVIESLFRGKPVVTSTLSSLPEAAGPGAILVNPYQHLDIGKAMIDLHNPSIYNSCATDGKRYVNGKFGSEETADALMELFLNVK